MITKGQKYPYLVSDVLLEKGSAFYVVRKIKENVFKYRINSDMAIFIESINGRMSVEDIIKYHKINNDGVDVSVFKKLSEIGMIGYSDQPTFSSLGIIENNKMITRYPTHMSIKVTSSCNFNCTYCYNGGSEIIGKSLEYNQLIMFLSVLKERGLKSIELTGGEPLLYHKIKELLSYAVNNFAMTGVLTNGSILNDDILGILINNREKVAVSVSYDSSEEKVFNKNTETIGFHSIVENNIKKLINTGVCVRATICVLPETFDGLEETFDSLLRMGVKHIGYDVVMPYGKGKKYEDKWNKEDYDKKYKKIENGIHKKYGKHIEYKKDKHCGAGLDNYTLDVNGDIALCVLDIDNMLNIGNIYNNSLAEIFDVVSRGTDRTKLVAPNEDICGECEEYQFCKSCIIRGIDKGANKEDGCKWYRKYITQLN